MGWKNESARHQMAARGISTNKRPYEHSRVDLIESDSNIHRNLRRALRIFLDYDRAPNNYNITKTGEHKTLQGLTTYYSILYNDKLYKVDYIIDINGTWYEIIEGKQFIKSREQAPTNRNEIIEYLQKYNDIDSRDYHRHFSKEEYANIYQTLRSLQREGTVEFVNQYRGLGYTRAKHWELSK